MYYQLAPLLAIIALLLISSCATCPNYSPEKKWLIEDAEIHEYVAHWGHKVGYFGLSASEHSKLAKRFREIATYIDAENIDKNRVEKDTVFLYRCLLSHLRSNNPWDKMWVERYTKIIKKLEAKRNAGRKPCKN